MAAPQPANEASIDCIAFDFDGTLADTSPAIIATALRAFRELGLPAFAPERLRRLIGLPLDEAFRGLDVPPEQLPAAAQRYRALFPEEQASVTLFPGAEHCLRELRERGTPLAIVSSRSRASLLQLLELLGIVRYFSAVLGAEDAPRRKPAPDPLFQLSALLDVPLARILVIGDTTYDIEMGHAAGARTCAVTYGNHDRAQLEQARPHHHLDALVDLTGLLLP